MGKIIAWYYLMLKSMLKNKSFCIELFVIAIILLITSFVSLPEAGNMSVGTVNNTLPALFNGNDFACQEYTNEDDLRRAVLSGEVDCGFIFPKDVVNKIKENDINKSITCISTPLSIKSEVAKESVYVAILKEKSKRIITENLKTVYPQKWVKLEESLLEKNEEYMDKDGVFQVEITEYDTDKGFSIKKNTIIKIFFLLASSLYILISERKRILPYYKWVTGMAMITPIIVLGLVFLYL